MPRSQRPRKRHNVRKTLVAPTDKRQHPFHAWRTFDPVYKLLDTLKTGEIDAVQGKPVMADWDSELMEVAPALDGWISCWDRICTGESIRMDLAPMRQLQRYLANGLMLTEAMIDAARQVTDACYTIYCSLPRRITIEYCQIEEMAIKVEELGLADAGARA